jgi:hypothetical protein
MPYSIGLFEDVGLLVVTYSEPFSASDLLAAAKSATSAGTGPGQHRCVLVDLRTVDLSNFSGADSRRFATSRKARVGDNVNDPAAFLIRSSGDFGTLRMHNQWVEVMGLRDERFTLVCQDLLEALTWLGKKTDQPDLVDAMVTRMMVTDVQTKYAGP